MNLFEGVPTDLEAVLAAREARVARRDAALLEYRHSVITLSIVLPGSVKLCPATMELAEAARLAIPARLAVMGWRFGEVFAEDLPTGPEALYVVETEAHALKSAMVALEESHPLGRLWDLDVHAADGTPLSRGDVGLQKRRCLLCDEPAHACTRSRAHPVEDLLAVIAERMQAARDANSLALRDEPGKP
ncbi:citrate lyase holo-[acyl-carrier protein] synthase [Aliiruegeria sabulilitoris]|uniref:citrate lyase holo-[acyl-carrier protein] synthase n=1 Tax=Aliiruegeria sabulilitoris TaxID=1510458 RepID=UPI00082F0AAB|nr:citrate lyase holo-[acyl-carrier protein] synthase [Aliiruegeria sabulilitoris]NDR58414.1 citrate lyase holo-[acyl-carrier protein] synthase [Pseudoruegeria sp. M32A2M]